jgi:hypothetical protein
MTNRGPVVVSWGSVRRAEGSSTERGSLDAARWPTLPDRQSGAGHSLLHGLIHALDEDTGKVLSSATLPVGFEGIPSMYEANGWQYLVVPSSSNMTQGADHAKSRRAPRTVRSDLPRGYVAFTLPGNECIRSDCGQRKHFRGRLCSGNGSCQIHRLDHGRLGTGGPWPTSVQTGYYRVADYPNTIRRLCAVYHDVALDRRITIG